MSRLPGADEAPDTMAQPAARPVQAHRLKAVARHGANVRHAANGATVRLVERRRDAIEDVAGRDVPRIDAVAITNDVAPSQSPNRWCQFPTR